MKALTTKQTLFVEAYLASPNGVAAARAAGYKGNDKTLSVVASENLAKPCIAERLRERVEAAIITADEILTDVKAIAKDTEEPAAVRLKAYEMLGKNLAMWTDNVKHGGEMSQKIVVEYLDDGPLMLNNGDDKKQLNP